MCYLKYYWHIFWYTDLSRLEKPLACCCRWPHSSLTMWMVLSTDVLSELLQLEFLRRAAAVCLHEDANSKLWAHFYIKIWTRYNWHAFRSRSHSDFWFKFEMCWVAYWINVNMSLKAVMQWKLRRVFVRMFKFKKEKNPQTFLDTR